MALRGDRESLRCGAARAALLAHEQGAKVRQHLEDLRQKNAMLGPEDWG